MVLVHIFFVPSSTHKSVVVNTLTFTTQQTVNLELLLFDICVIKCSIYRSCMFYSNRLDLDRKNYISVKEFLLM